MSKSDLLTHSYSGSDFNIRAFVDVRDVLPDGITIGSLVANLESELGTNWKDQFKTWDPTDLLRDNFQIPFGDMQTITSSMAASTSAVMNVGHSQPAGITRGQKTYAGSLIFTLLNRDPLLEFFQIGSLFSQDANARFTSIDQFPKFNIVIHGQTEVVKNIDQYVTSGGTDNLTFDTKQIQDAQSITKMIMGIRLNQFGETLSIDDFFTEQVYQYVAEWVSPWKKGELSINDFLNDNTFTTPGEIVSPEDFKIEDNTKNVDNKLRTGSITTDNGIDVIEMTLPSLEKEISRIEASFQNT